MDDRPRDRLFQVNAFLGTAIVTLSLGGMLVYQASSALGGTTSTAMRLVTRKLPWAPLVVAFPVLVWLGQVQVNHPERLPWAFALTNVLIVSVPSIAIALFVSQRYVRYNAWAWPFSWREWTSGLIYGAIGATAVGAVVNTLYLLLAGAWLISAKGQGDAWSIGENLSTVPGAWGIAFDLSVLSVVAPLNEEFWKGMLVAFFFFRKGGAARCFAWGVLAGAGFNVLETFQNSLTVVNPGELTEQQISEQWWLFAVGRAGTGALHATASGLSALGFHGLFRRRPLYLAGYPAGVLIHGLWNFLNYTLAGDTILSGSGPDSALLDVLSIAGLAALFALCLVALWVLSMRLRDGFPAPIYGAIGMVPAPKGPAPPR
ncbi:MAG TPA: PrsW family glutamic-type intramembrane protease [Tepidiformaceae bacterium]|nr:PrsW family glutamic-type intramembrane protease [Tepidiformaceae bacterium]